QRARDDEQRRREAAELLEVQRARDDEQRNREAVQEKLRNTTLPELLDGCHIHLHLGLTVQNVALSTKGHPANADNKLRPDRILEWDDFPAQQEAIWGELMDSQFASERHFTNLNALEANGEMIRRRRIGSEIDLHIFQRSTLDDYISSIITQLYNNPTLRSTFQLQGAVEFENHANMLNPESQPLADQFCVYNTSTSSQDTKHRVAAFVMEYKAPHKVSLGRIYEGLHDMDLNKVLRRAKSDTSQDRQQRLIAAVITQAFSYMVQAGLEYGCVCTGEATIFLRVPDNPRTVYYFLSVPKGDVGQTTGWTPNSEGENRLHLTAVGQMLAFTLQALKTPPRSHNWRADAASTLKNWVIVYDELVRIASEDNPSSEYRPPQRNRFLRMSPVRLRPRPTQTSLANCGPARGQHKANDEEPDTPSRRQSPSRRTTRSQAKTPTTNSSLSSHGSRHGAQSGPYCTQNCLRGLVIGGPLDMLCPNVRDHGESHHQIDQTTFLALIREQLAQDLDTDCTAIGRPGACGAPYRIRLRPYGYTTVAKATTIYLVDRLLWEATIYEHLRPIQGIHVPVHLGNINLVRPLFEGFALVHMMFLSFGGELVGRHITAKNEVEVIRKVENSVRAIERLGVQQNDLAPRNMLWNREIGSIMIIDFERAKFVKPQAVLGVPSPNQKRRSSAERSLVKQPEYETPFLGELGRAISQLRALIERRD
ncbi:hypothetical protein K505DRAFT_260706, partial [Melanomma pulvis-pyrius CBS 109.77]